MYGTGLKLTRKGTMRISWDAKFDNYTHGYECEQCFDRADPQGFSMGWFTVNLGGMEWHFCSTECLRMHDYRALNARHPDYSIVGGK